MSSANSRALLLRESGRSFIYERNRQGPNTDPWGTPDITGTSGDCLPSTTTDWLSWRNVFYPRDCFKIYTQIEEFVKK